MSDSSVPGPPAQAARAAAGELSPLLVAAPASGQLEILLSFIRGHASALSDRDEFGSRLSRGRAGVLEVLEGLKRAHGLHDDAPIAIGELATSIRRKIEERTFEPDSGARGVHLLDDQAARYGEFDDVAIVGFIEHEWPERPRRNIFFPTALLTALGWPSEKARRDAGEAQFLDLLESSAARVCLSTITLDDETLVQPSILADQIADARLQTTAEAPLPSARVFAEEALSLEPIDVDALDPPAREWAEMRLSRTPGRMGPAPTAIGADTRDVLREWGFADDEVSSLIADATVASAE